MQLEEKSRVVGAALPSSTPWFKIGLVAFLLTTAIILLSLPNRTIIQTPLSVPDRDGNLRFSGAEKHPDGYQFAWATPESALIYPDVPRYAPLNLTLRLNLQRPPGVTPARIEVYERAARFSEDTATVEGTEQQIAVLSFDPAKPEPQDYSITVPPRANGDGVYITFKSNAFQVPNDRRELAFMFIRAELKMGAGTLRYLFWPYCYFPAVFIFLAGTIAWGRWVGLGWLANSLFNAQLAYVLMMAAQSTWRISWLMLILALVLWGTYFWVKLWRKRGLSEIGPLFAACALVVGFFLLTDDEIKRDIQFYVDWGRAIHNYGIWNVYIHDSTLNYLPLIIYLLWFYNLFAYPLGLQGSLLAWRIVASLLFLVCVWLLYLIGRLPRKKTEGFWPIQTPAGESEAEITSPKSSQTGGYSLPAMLFLVGFNVSIFYNPTIWGQSDVIAFLPLVLAFYLIYRGNPYLAGLALALTAISKPQAWFVLPLGLLLHLKIFGLRRGIFSLLPGFAVALLLSLAAFGLSWDSFSRYWNQGQLAGDFRYQFPTVYNLSYLLIPQNAEPPRWFTLLGFGLVGLVGLGVAWQVWRGASRLRENTLAAGLMNSACYLFLIKMKERYLIYGMPLFGLGTLYSKRILWPYLAISWLQLLNLSILMFQSERFRLQTLPENFYFWSSLLSQQWLRQGIAIAFLITLAGTLALYWQESKQAIVQSKRLEITKNP